MLHTRRHVLQEVPWLGVAYLDATQEQILLKAIPFSQNNVSDFSLGKKIVVLYLDQDKFGASIFPKSAKIIEKRLRTRCDWTSFEQMGNAASKAPKAPKAVRKYPSPSTPAQTKIPFPLPAQTTHQPADVKAKLEGKYLRKET